jgi:hypothetical protein
MNDDAHAVYIHRYTDGHNKHVSYLPHERIIAAKGGRVVPLEQPKVPLKGWAGRVSRGRGVRGSGGEWL